MSKEEAIVILSEMRSEYNLFGDEEEATRYHVLSWAIKQMNAEPVVRCKDCEYYLPDEPTICELTMCGANDEGFCAWAERKRDAEEE